MLYSDFLENNKKSITKRKKQSYIVGSIYLICVILLFILSSRETKVVFTILFVILTLVFFTYLLGYVYLGTISLKKMNDKVEKNKKAKQEIKHLVYEGTKRKTIDDDQTVLFAYDFFDNQNKISLTSYLDLPLKKDVTYNVSFRSLFILEVGNYNE